MNTSPLRQRRRTGAAACVAVLGAMAIAPAPGAAQDVYVPVAQVLTPAAQPPAAPAALANRDVPLSEAVRLAILHNATVNESRETLISATGSLVQTRGAFDYLFRFSPGLNYSYVPLHPATRGREENKRLQLEVLSGAFARLDLELQDIMEANSPRAPLCPSGLELLGTDQSFSPERFGSLGGRFARRDPSEQAFTGTTTDLRNLGLIQVDVGGVSLGSLCVPADDNRTRAESFNDFWRGVDRIAAAGIDRVVQNVTQFPGETIRLSAEIAQTIAVRSRLGLERLGPMPTEEVGTTFLLDTSLGKLFRTGIQGSLDVHIEGVGRNFADKPYDPIFGALEFPTRHTSSASASLLFPLARGRGRASIAAPERAAEFTLDAQQDTVRHTIAEQAFRTVLAYLNVVALQERVRLLDESTGRQSKIADLTRQLIEAGDVPGAEGDRADAQIAALRGSANAARQQLIDARFELADLMGVEIEGPAGAPVATNALATQPVTLPPLDALLQTALARRRDVQAFQALEEASSALAAGARADMRPIFDLTVTGGMAAFSESPFDRFLRDELNPVIDDFDSPLVVRDSATRFYSINGYGRSLDAKWQPFVTVGFAFGVPFGNNAARGRAARTQATHERSQIETRNLTRAIRENVVSAAGALRHAAAAIARREQAVENFTQAAEAVVLRLREGEATVFDALLSEEDLSREQLQLIRDRQVYLSALARLRFETGELITFDNLGTASEVVRLDLAELTRR